MTDSKTAKKIEVCPCWFDKQFSKKRKNCHIEVDGNEFFENGKRWCGTEAEAQAKAAELEYQQKREALIARVGSSPAQGDIDRLTERIETLDEDFAAATQPTETRPPQTALQNMLNAIHCLRLEVDGSIVDDIHNKFMAALSETLDVYRAARAAAPVETPKQEDPNIQPATYDGMRPPESEVILKFISQSRHLPDCPDECHGKCAQRIAQSFFDDGLATKHNWEALLDDVLEVHNAAASSPVARPQKIWCEECDAFVVYEERQNSKTFFDVVGTKCRHIVATYEKEN